MERKYSKRPPDQIEDDQVYATQYNLAWDLSMRFPGKVFNLFFLDGRYQIQRDSEEFQKRMFYTGLPKYVVHFCVFGTLGESGVDEE